MFEVRHKTTGILNSVKKIDKFKLQFSSQTKKNLHKGEMEALRAISHPKIAKVTHMIDNKYFLYIVFEHVELGNLKDHTWKVHGHTELQVVFIVKQLLEALNALHKQGICHRNLKPENVNVIDYN